MGLEGLFGIPLDVAATYIVLFTFYGAVLEFSGAARFFVELSYAAFGRTPHRPGPDDDAGRLPARHRLRLRRGDDGHARLGDLAAAAQGRLSEGRGRRRCSPPRGIGAILSPPTLGAAAFIIAEFLEVSYLQVLLYALVPSLLYYLGVLLAIEADARRFQVKGIDARDARRSGGCSPAGATTSRR